LNNPDCIESAFKKTHESDLWVEKFKPKDYFELLSDDGTNRLLLTWIKSWDYVVFGKDVDKEKINNRAKEAAAAALNQGKKRKGAYVNPNERELEEKLELDEFNRPKIKVALISGPPGLGKTTLAHIIAKRAGYNFIEMNASDDRSVDSFKEKIESVTQIRGTVNDSGMKPSCLIIGKYIFL
jgi:chromosome transmission fidelity protein 18